MTRPAVKTVFEKFKVTSFIICRAAFFSTFSSRNNEKRPELLEVINMKNREILKAMRIVLAHQAKLSEAWSKIHG